MAGLFSKLIADNSKQRAGEVRLEYSDLILQKYEIVAISDDAASITEIDTIITLGDNGEEQRDFKFRCIYEKGKNKPAVRGMEDGEWKIVWCR